MLKLKVTYKLYGAGQALIFYCYCIFELHVTIINKNIYVYVCYLTLLKDPFKGIQFLVGMQYLIIKKCISLIPLLLGVQHMMHHIKDQRGNAEFDGDAKSDVTLVSGGSTVLILFLNFYDHFV